MLLCRAERGKPQGAAVAAHLAAASTEVCNRRAWRPRPITAVIGRAERSDFPQVPPCIWRGRGPRSLPPPRPPPPPTQRPRPAVAASGRGNVTLARVACARLRPCGPPLRCSAPLAPRPSPMTGAALRSAPVTGRRHPPRWPRIENARPARPSPPALRSASPALARRAGARSSPHPLSFLAAKAARIAAVRGPAAKERRLWSALVATAALLLTAPQAFASRTVSTRPELLTSPAIEQPAATEVLVTAYVHRGFELRIEPDPHPRQLALFPGLAPPPASLAGQKRPKNSRLGLRVGSHDLTSSGFR